MLRLGCLRVLAMVWVCLGLAACQSTQKPMPPSSGIILPEGTDVLAPKSPYHIVVGVRSQTLNLYEGGKLLRHYIVSTSKNGVGEQENSYKTPRGRHVICEKIGDGVPINTIIYRRKVTEWKYTPQLHKEYPDKDWILTRILWLCGEEPGFNQGGSVDSHDRAIYIHGAGDHVKWGTPTSRGCVRMKGEDVIDLYNRVPVGTEVFIDEHA